MNVFSDSIFNNKPKAKKTYFILLSLLFLLGFYHWCNIFNFGNISYQSGDWTKQYKYYVVLKEFVTTGQVPYHVSEKFQTTDRFMGNPEIDFSPQILLLRFISVKSYFIVNLMLFYMIGFIGCLLIKKRFKLTLFTFALLFTLFNFNGYITSHFTGGHYMWLTYFFFPFFFLLVMDLYQGTNPVRTWILLAGVMFAVYLNAAPHTYIWLMLFLVFFAIFNKNSRKYIFYVILANAGLLAFRILPNAVTYADHMGTRAMGYFSLGNLLEALTVIRNMQYYPDGSRYAWCEYDMYVDVLGLAAVSFFGIWLSISKKWKDSIANFKPLYLPLMALFLLSLGRFYRIITTIPIPLFNSENVTSRFIIVPAFALFMFTAVRMDAFLPKLKSGYTKTLAVFALVFLMTSLFTHSNIWNVNNFEKIHKIDTIDLNVKIIEKNEYTYDMAVKPSQTNIKVLDGFIAGAQKIMDKVTRNEPFYKTVVNYSPLISLASLLFLFGLYIRAGKKQKGRAV